MPQDLFYREIFDIRHSMLHETDYYLWLACHYDSINQLIDLASQFIRQGAAQLL